MDYFISDLHFDHNNIMRFERSQFNNIEEHNEFIINSINKKVKVTDKLYILGDIGNPEYVRYLNGYKILLKGNHDKRHNKEYQTYFNEIHENPFYYQRRVLLSHYPHPCEDHILNIHGHLHKAILDLNNYLNVSCHMINYEPISEKDILRKINELPKEKRKFKEEWYSDFYKFT